MREARARYFAENGFGDGGYDSRFVKLQLGPVPFWMLNTQSRVRSVRLHDVHHVLTGYRTDLLGEGEIGAFELGAGCADHYAAWFLNLNAVVLALPLGPARLLRAFARGRRSGCLYDQEWDEALLEESVAGLRRRLGVAEPELQPTAGEALGFAATALAALAVFLGPFALLVGLVRLLL